jgi:hypothetical protein
MPLIDFKTNLTSLKYGLDQPGGGYSGQPYIQNPIEGPNTPSATRRYYEINRTGLDFPIRGGAISALVDGAFSAVTATVDRERIQKFFKDAPRGTAFIQKQVGLQLTNPRTQVPNTIQFAGSVLGNAVLPVTQTYNPLNTLAQVQVQGTGAHFNRQGVVPTITESLQQTYEYIAGAPQNNTASTNRLLILKSLKLGNLSGFAPTRGDIIDIGVAVDKIEELGISPISNQLFNYPGGPGSVYGIGNTRIFRYSNTEATNFLDNNTVGFTIGGDPTPVGVSRPYSAIALTYQQLADQDTRTTNPVSPTQAAIQDFRSQTNNGSPVIPWTDYTLYNIAKPYDGLAGGLGIGNPGEPLRETNPLFAKPGGVDLLNKVNPFYYNASTETPWTAGGNDTKDIIKFAFECMSNDNPDYAVALIFRAFLEGQISDSNSAEFDSFKYLGRGETFRTYQGFDRTIGFSFKVFAQTREEVRPLYTKLNTLLSQLYPDYSPQSKLMRGSVVRLTIGDYIYRMPGFLENISITIDNSNTPWEIQLYGPLVESDVAQLPHMVTVYCSFRPIMDILPSRVTMANPRVSLIGNVEKDIFMGNIVDKTPTPQIPIPQEDEIVIVDEDVRIPAIQVGANSADTATKKKAVVNKANKQAAAKANAKAKQGFIPQGPAYGIGLTNQPGRTPSQPTPTRSNVNRFRPEGAPGQFGGGF